MKRKLKTVIKEYHDDNVVCFDIPFLTAIFSYCKSAPLSSEELNALIKKIIEHGIEEDTLTMSHYDHIISK